MTKIAPSADCRELEFVQSVIETARRLYDWPSDVDAALADASDRIQEVAVVPRVVRPDGLPTPETVSVLTGHQVVPTGSHEYYVEIDYVLEDGETATQAADRLAFRHDLHVAVVSEHGPAGGASELRLMGTWPRLWGFLEGYFKDAGALD